MNGYYWHALLLLWLSMWIASDISAARDFWRVVTGRKGQTQQNRYRALVKERPVVYRVGMALTVLFAPLSHIAVLFYDIHGMGGLRAVFRQARTEWALYRRAKREKTSGS